MADLSKIEVVRLLSEKIGSFVGIKEDQGPNRSKIIDAINGYIHAALGSSYCLSGLLYCISLVEKEHYLRFSLPLSSSCTNFFKLCSPNIVFDSPQVGDIIIWQFLGTWLGHAGYVEKILENGMIQTIEFNTSNGIGINRNGDGCYRRTRSVSGSRTMRVKGFIRIIDALV